MPKTTFPDGVVHTAPPDFKKAILSSSAAKEAWADITPLARNEWIRWVTSAKKEETRAHRIKRMCEDLSNWPGCPHR